MEDEASILLDGKTLGNLRVVDLKQELEKRGLSKSGSKKELVKRLKVQLDFEKLCGERKSAQDCDLKLDLDADTEKNEFVQQYLAQQQKIYAEQKEAKRRIELEENLKVTEEKVSCDSTKCDEDVTVDEDEDQTESEEEDSIINKTNWKEEKVTKADIASPEVGTTSSELHDADQKTSKEETECLEVQDNSSPQISNVKVKISEILENVNQEASQHPNVEAVDLNIQDVVAQDTSQPLKTELESSEVQDSGIQETSRHKSELEISEVRDSVIQATSKLKIIVGSSRFQNDGVHEAAEFSNIDEVQNVDQETSQPAKVETMTTEVQDVVDQETFKISAVEAANARVQYDAVMQETSDAVSFLEKELVKDTAATENEDYQNQIISSNNVQTPMDSSVEATKSPETIDHTNDQITSSGIIETSCINPSTENIKILDTTCHQAKHSQSSEIIQNQPAEFIIENPHEISHIDSSSKVIETVPDIREQVLPKSEPLVEMEPATQFSSVPYSLMDIQLPESPGNVKSKPSDSAESESTNNTEETHSNGIDSTDVKRNNRNGEKADSKDDSSEKVCSPGNNSNFEKSEEFTQQTKECTSEDSKLLESRSECKKKESDSKSSRSKEHGSDRKTRRSKDDLSSRRDSRSKSRERKRTHRSSEDSSHRYSRSRSRERARKLKGDSRRRRESRSRSKEKDRKARKYEKDSDTRKISHSHRDSRSKSKENDRKSRNENKGSKNRRALHTQRKTHSMSNDSKSDHSSDSDEELQKRKHKSKETKQKRIDRKKRSDSESDKSDSSSSDSPSRSSKQKVHSTRHKDKHLKHHSSEGTQSSRSRSPVKKKPARRSDDHSESSVADKHERRKNKDENRSSGSRSRDSSPIKKKTKGKPAEKSDKQKEISHKEEISDGEKVPKNIVHEDSSIKAKSKNDPVEPQTLSVDDGGKECKPRSPENEMSRSGSQERSPLNKSLGEKSFEQNTDSASLVKTSKSRSLKGSRSRSREKSPLESKVQPSHESPTDIKRTQPSEEVPRSRNSKSRSSSPEHRPVERKPIKSPSDPVITSKTSAYEKEPESGNSDDNQTSRSESRESIPVQTEKGSTDKSSIDLAKRSRLESESSVDERDSRSMSREKSPDPKRSKISISEPNGDSSDAPNNKKDPTKTCLSINDIPGAIKKGNILILKKEPVKQKIKIKRDNVVCHNKKEENKIESEKPKTTESSAELPKEPASEPVRSQYVSRKIVLSSRSQSVASDDEPKSKRSKWGNVTSSQKTSTAINISTDSLKNWFPDFKLLKDPMPEEPASLPKEEIDMEISVNPDEDSRQVSSTKKLQEPQQEVQMEVEQEETGPVSRILFIQNLVRPFTLNQLKELLRETGDFVDEEFWIDKIKSKCFVTYKTEEEAVKTRNHLNGTRWPSSNPKILCVEFSNEEELLNHRSGNDAPKAVLHPVLEPIDAQDARASISVDEFRKKGHDQDRKRDRSKPHLPVREWDKDKITQESPDREHSGKDSDRSKYPDKKEKKDSKRRANEDTPAKLLDDLFQKTKSSPCIYWLPLTDEQIQERRESIRLRRVEREKRNQQREQEEAENKSKRPRSRNRTREAETRRSSTRSRSPVTRRR